MPTVPTILYPADGEEGLISRSAQKQIQAILNEIPANKKGAFVTVVEQHQKATTITVAVGTRTENGWEAATWLRTNVKDQLEAGGYLKRTW